MKKLIHSSYLMPILLFLLLYSWHPFVMGIYSDDWGLLLGYFVEKPGDMSPFSFDRLQYFFSEFANRPLSGFFYYIVSSISGYNIISIHIIILFLIIISLLSLNLFLKELFKLINIEDDKQYRALTLSFWIVSPWILGFTVWLSSALNMAAMIFFLLSSYYLLKNWNDGKNRYILSTIFYLLSCLTYESFYFQYFILVAIGFIYKVHKRSGWRCLVLPTIYYSGIVLISIVWNRYSSIIFEKAIHKGANNYWLQTFIANIVSLPYSLFTSIIELSFVLVPLIILIASIYIKIIILGKKKQNNEILHSFYIMLLFALGITLAFLIYSGAGYTIWGIGSRSRTLLVPSIYFAIGFSIIINMIIKYGNINRKFINITVIIFILGLAIISLIRSNEWRTAWQEQKEIISKIPVEYFKNLDSNTTIIFDGPYKTNWISIIDASWAVDYQFKYGHIFIANNKEIKSISDANFEVGKGMVHPVLDKPYSIYWDGERIITGYGIDSLTLKNLKAKYYNKIDTLPAKTIIIWQYDSNRFEYPKAPIKLTFEPFYNYDYWITWLWVNWIKSS